MRVFVSVSSVAMCVRVFVLTCKTYVSTCR